METIDLCIIYSKDTIVNYSSVYNKIKSLNIDAIIIDKSSFVLDKEIFEFATYIRLMKNNIWDVPIYIYCNFILLVFIYIGIFLTPLVKV